MSASVADQLLSCQRELAARPGAALDLDKCAVGCCLNVSVEHVELGRVRVSWGLSSTSSWTSGFAFGALTGYLPWLVLGLGYVT